VLVAGYFEGVRIISDWQHDQMFGSALTVALMVGIASLMCGAVIYPVVVRLSAENVRKTNEILVSHISMMEALGRAIAKRDSDTGAHNLRVAWTAARIGEGLGLHGKPMQSLIIGSFLHDVGKVGIPDAILRKPARLSAEETEIMQTHVAQGEEIVSNIDWLEEAKAVVVAHHERWDGSGYPRKLAGEAIPLAARIFAVADVFDALCSRRAYKEPMNFQAAMNRLEAEAGSHFDPKVMAAFRPIAREVFDCLFMANEKDIQRMLEQRIRMHFTSDFPPPERG
jgi:HD-GYP domain-containing protein (c-di-GMP phosphodiesterase class II)